jgi:hypothetical protein
MKKPITESTTVKIGGKIASSFRAYQDGLEVILIVQCMGSYIPVVFSGRKAHQAAKIQRGTWIETKGELVENPGAIIEKGWKIPFSLAGKSLRIGTGKADVTDPLENTSELPKSAIFKACFYSQFRKSNV